MPIDPVTVVTTINVGKSFLGTVRNIFRKDIKPLIGPYVYRYTDHPFGWFNIKTGQHFGSASSVLILYKQLNHNRSNPTDGLVYLQPEKKFAGYRLYNGKLYDANAISFGTFVPNEGARTALKRKSAYNEIPVSAIPIRETQKTINDEVVSGSQKLDFSKLIVPVVGVALLLFKK